MARLGDVCNKITDGSHNPPAGIATSEYMMLSSKNIEDDNITYTDPRYLDKSEFETENRRTQISSGDLLMTIVGTVGRVAVVDCHNRNICLQRSVAVLKPKAETVDSRFLMYQIQSMRQMIENESHGVAQKGIYLLQVEQLPIVLPDLPTQRRIAATLDKVSKGIALCKQMLVDLDELVKSQFVEMFGDPVANDKGWPMTTLKEIAEIRIGPFGTMLHREDYIEGGHALVNPSHIVDGQIVVDPNLTVTDEKYAELASYWLYPSDVVLGRRGEMGRCAVVHEEGLLCGTGSMIIRPSEKIKPYFLQSIISSPGYRKLIEDKAVGVTMMNLNVPIVSELSFPLLPVDAQETFIAFMHQCDKSKFAVQQQLAELETLKMSLMQKYFSEGNL